MCVTDTLTHDTLDVDDLDALYPAGELLPESATAPTASATTQHLCCEQHFEQPRRCASSDPTCVNVYYTRRALHRASRSNPTCWSSPAWSQGATRGQSKSYRTFQHGGKLLFVLEIASPRAPQTPTTADKRATYAAIGVAEYWRVDPTGGEHPFNEILQGERLHRRPLDTHRRHRRRHRDLARPQPLPQPRHRLVCPRTPLLPPRPATNHSPTSPRAEAALPAERNARQAAETAHRAERNARLTAENACRSRTGGSPGRRGRSGGADGLR